jgi:hypothetical protein
MGRGRARHETINRIFTDWCALRDVYRHDLKKQHLIFGAIAILTQMEMLQGVTPFQCFSQHDSALIDELLTIPVPRVQPFIERIGSTVQVISKSRSSPTRTHSNAFMQKEH